MHVRIFEMGEGGDGDEKALMGGMLMVGGLPSGLLPVRRTRLTFGDVWGS